MIWENGVLTWSIATGFGLPFGVAGKCSKQLGASSARRARTGADEGHSLANIQEPIDGLGWDGRYGLRRMVNHRRVASEDRHRNHGIVQILLTPFHMSIIDELKYTYDLFQYLTDSTDVIGRAFPLFYLCLRLSSTFISPPSLCKYLVLVTIRTPCLWFM